MGGEKNRSVTSCLGLLFHLSDEKVGQAICFQIFNYGNPLYEVTAYVEA